MIIRPIPLTMAQYAVEIWHRHHDPAIGHRWSLGAFVGVDLVGVAMCGRPVARGFDPGVWIEVNRVATPGMDVDPRCRCACSELYKASASEAERRGFSRITTYTLASESGYSLRVARWRPVAEVEGREWSCASRPRDASPETAVDKVRWEPRRALVPQAVAQGVLFSASAAGPAVPGDTTRGST